MADSISDGLTGKAPTSGDEQPAQTEALFSAEALTVSKILFFGPGEENPVPALPAAPDPAAEPAVRYRPAAGGHPESTPQKETPAVAPAAAVASDGSNADAVVETKPGRRTAARPRKQSATSVDGAGAQADDEVETDAKPASRARRTPAKKIASQAAAASNSVATSGPAAAAAPAGADPASGAGTAPAKPARKPRSKKVAAATATTERSEVRAIVSEPAETVSAAAEAATDSTSTEAVPMAQEIPPQDASATGETAPPATTPERTPAKAARKSTADGESARKRAAKVVPAQQAPAAEPTPVEDTEAVTPTLAGDQVPEGAVLEGTVLEGTVLEGTVLEGTVLDGPAAEEVAASAEVTASPVFAVLAAEPFLSLTTFRKSGTPVPTPVWAAPDGDTLLVWTGAESGKVKRLRHSPGVTVAPCDRQGRLLGDPVPATARILPPEELARVKAAMTEKYGWQFRMSAFGAMLGRHFRIAPHGQIGLSITLE